MDRISVSYSELHSTVFVQTGRKQADIIKKWKALRWPAHYSHALIAASFSYHSVVSHEKAVPCKST